MPDTFAVRLQDGTLIEYVRGPAITLCNKILPDYVDEVCKDLRDICEGCEDSSEAIGLIIEYFHGHCDVFPQFVGREESVSMFPNVVLTPWDEDGGCYE